MGNLVTLSFANFLFHSTCIMLIVINWWHKYQCLQEVIMGSPVCTIMTSYMLLRVVIPCMERNEEFLYQFNNQTYHEYPWVDRACAISDHFSTEPPKPVYYTEMCMTPWIHINPDSKDRHINFNQIAIRCERVWSMFNRRRCKGLCHWERLINSTIMWPLTCRGDWGQPHTAPEGPWLQWDGPQHMPGEGQFDHRSLQRPDPCPS